MVLLLGQGFSATQTLLGSRQVHRITHKMIRKNGACGSGVVMNFFVVPGIGSYSKNYRCWIGLKMQEICMFLRILSSSPALYHDLWIFVDQTNLPRIIESSYGRVVKSQIGSGQAMGPSKKLFPNRSPWNMARVLGTENRTDLFMPIFAHHKPGK